MRGNEKQDATKEVVGVDESVKGKGAKKGMGVGGSGGGSGRE
jgi:hypothetical protein